MLCAHLSSALCLASGNGDSGNNSNEGSGGEGKRGSNKGSNSGSGNETDPCDKDGNGTSKDPATAAAPQRCALPRSFTEGGPCLRQCTKMVPCVNSEGPCSMFRGCVSGCSVRESIAGNETGGSGSGNATRVSNGGCSQLKAPLVSYCSIVRSTGCLFKTCCSPSVSASLKSY